MQGVGGGVIRGNSRRKFEFDVGVGAGHESPDCVPPSSGDTDAITCEIEKNGGVNESKMKMLWLSLEAVKYHRRPLQEAFIAMVRDLDGGAEGKSSSNVKHRLSY